MLCVGLLSGYLTDQLQSGGINMREFVEARVKGIVETLETLVPKLREEQKRDGGRESDFLKLVHSVSALNVELHALKNLMVEYDASEKVKN